MHYVSHRLLAADPQCAHIRRALLPPRSQTTAANSAASSWYWYAALRQWYVAQHVDFRQWKYHAEPHSRWNGLRNPFSSDAAVVLQRLVNYFEVGRNRWRSCGRPCCKFQWSWHFAASEMLRLRHNHVAQRRDEWTRIGPISSRRPIRSLQSYSTRQRFPLKMLIPKFKKKNKQIILMEFCSQFLKYLYYFNPISMYIYIHDISVFWMDITPLFVPVFQHLVLETTLKIIYDF